jgi:hypothetical protein
MMKLISCSLLVICIATVSCTKKSTPNPETLKTSLWPLKFGNTWVYQDSVFSDTAFTGTYPDTAVVLHQTLSDPSGLIYFEVYNPNGWFGSGSYFSVDPNNTEIYAFDSTSNANYLFFQIASPDGTLVGNGTDYTNATCPVQENQYGFATTTTINGYTCYKNIEYNTDCKGVVLETIVTYVAAGAGVVRIEDYLADSTKNNNQYLTYSQTLLSQSIN